MAARADTGEDLTRRKRECLGDRAVLKDTRTTASYALVSLRSYLCAHFPTLPYTAMSSSMCKLDDNSFGRSTWPVVSYSETSFQNAAYDGAWFAAQKAEFSTALASQSVA